MARNTERDLREANRRKDQLIEAGFRLFSANGIEAVSMQAVAEAADVGTATMYNYYQNKSNLVIAISTSIWDTVWQNFLASHSPEELEKMNLYELIEVYADVILQLYAEQPEILCFSGNYKTFIRREGVPEPLLKTHLDVLEPLRILFHSKYERNSVDGCVRTDLSENELFTTTSLTMLTMAERYAQGIVWGKQQTADGSRQLVLIKEMILTWLRG